MTKNIYRVNFIEQRDLEVSNEANKIPWTKANELNHFVSPWSQQDVSQTVFRALWTSNDLFFQFEVEDTLIYIEEVDDSYESIGTSDRVEIFFRHDSLLNPYYCLEIDTRARVMDFKAFPNKNFDFQWNWPKEQLKVKSRTHKKGFKVEGSISIASLKDLNLIQKGCIETGIYRAKYDLNDQSELTPTWITWINPKTMQPDFHLDSSFGGFGTNLIWINRNTNSNTVECT